MPAVRGNAVLRSVDSPLEAAQTTPASPVTDVPRLSIVVLPFVDLRGLPEREYFVDGITESLTTDLSRIPDAFVIARNTPKASTPVDLACWITSPARGNTIAPTFG
jgi:TolB-like protein